ncbi:MAG: histidine phosphatase family protein [Elusimicrobiota bacterium]
MNRAALLALAMALAVPAAADIFIVRHAEKKNPKDDKSLLSPSGFKRADDLKRVFSSVDLKAVYRTEYERTAQTGVPTAAAHNLSPIETKSDDVKGLAVILKARPPSEDVLVVGHSDTIPDLLTELGVSTRAAIAPGDYDNLFIVGRREGADPVFHWLHYGDVPAASPSDAMKRKP